MKKYTAPTMEALAFTAMEDISAVTASVYNNDTFSAWDNPGAPANG